MSDRPILFSGPMVRALLEGRKVQTRRVLKPVSGLTLGTLQDEGERDGNMIRCARHQVREPRYAVGDRLWVREACAIWGRGPDRAPVLYPVVYAADDLGWDDIKHDARLSTGDEWKIRPSIHMPRWVSRLTLIVTEVRVQRLQDITLFDICAEGLARSIYEFTPIQRGFAAFEDLWDSLNAKRAPWDSNPWVVALTFAVHRCNIDQMEQSHE